MRPLWTGQRQGQTARCGAGTAPVWAWTRGTWTAGSSGLAAHGGHGERGFSLSHILCQAWLLLLSQTGLHPVSPWAREPFTRPPPRRLPEGNAASSGTPSPRPRTPLSESLPPGVLSPILPGHRASGSHQMPAGGSGPAGSRRGRRVDSEWHTCWALPGQVVALLPLVTSPCSHLLGGALLGERPQPPPHPHPPCLTRCWGVPGHLKGSLCHIPPCFLPDKSFQKPQSTGAHLRSASHCPQI